jgi:hypothetical protein
MEWMLRVAGGERAWAGERQPHPSYGQQPAKVVGADGTLLSPTHSGLTRLAATSGARAALPEVAIVASAAGDVTDAAFIDPQQKLLATGQFASVTIIHAGLETPTLAELNAFDAVLVWSNFDFADPVTLGDNLAAYVGLGGGVVTAVFANTSDATGRFLEGDWITEKHAVIAQEQANTAGFATLGAIDVPGHPVMAGVATFSGGTLSFRPETTDITTGGVLIASWSDGKPLVAVRDVPDAGKRVDLGFYPPSSDVLSFFWDAATDGDLLLANALTFAARPVPDVALQLIALENPSGLDTTTDPAALPNQITAGGGCANTFVLELWASDVGSTNTGLLGFYVDVDYDPLVFAATGLIHGELFDQFTEGTIVAPAGMVTNFGGFSFSPLGLEPQWVKLGHVEFMTLSDDLSSITSGLGARGDRGQWADGAPGWRNPIRVRRDSPVRAG